MVDALHGRGWRIDVGCHDNNNAVRLIFRAPAINVAISRDVTDRLLRRFGPGVVRDVAQHMQCIFGQFLEGMPVDTAMTIWQAAEPYLTGVFDTWFAALSPEPERIEDVWRLILGLEAELNRPSLEDIPESAKQKSRELLLRLLSPAQREEFQSAGKFTVQIRDGRQLRIERRHTFNVIDLGTRIRYCTHSATPVPIFDLMLAQKLMLETDPDSFFAVANDNAAPEVRPIS